MNQTTGDIAARLGGALIGDPAAPIHGAGTLQDGQPGEIGFLSEPHYRKYQTRLARTRRQLRPAAATARHLATGAH